MKQPLLEGLYREVERKKEEVSIALSDATHPVFKAHFPSNPLLPGFMHLELIEELFALEIQGIKTAKFKQKVLPNEIITYKKNDNAIKVYNRQNKEVATFSFTLSA